MPRPTSKSQLIAEIVKEYQALENELSALTPARMTEPGVVGEWSVKDVLGHLFEWGQMVLGWYETGKRGETPIVPAEGLTWRQIPELNQRIYEKHCDRSLEEMMHLFRTSHQRVFATVEELTDEELFTPKHYSWTNTTTLGSYFISASCSHYVWARKEIRKGLKAKQAAAH